jgi:hypothetical protein
MTKLKVRVVVFPSLITRVFHYVNFASYAMSYLILALLIKYCISQVFTDCRSCESFESNRSSIASIQYSPIAGAVKALNQTVTQHKNDISFLMRVMCFGSF